MREAIEIQCLAQFQTGIQSRGFEAIQELVVLLTIPIPPSRTVGVLSRPGDRGLHAGIVRWPPPHAECEGLRRPQGDVSRAGLGGAPAEALFGEPEERRVVEADLGAGILGLGEVDLQLGVAEDARLRGCGRQELPSRGH